MPLKNHPLGSVDDKFLGLDLSLRKAGLAVLDPVTVDTWLVECPEKIKGMRRLLWWRQQLGDFLDRHSDARLAGLEGYAMARGFRAHQLGEWGGMARHMLYERRIPTIIVPPKSLKMFITGNGNATKVKVAVDLVRRFGIDCDNEDEADAAALSIAALATTTYVTGLTAKGYTAIDKFERLPMAPRARSRAD